jgi:hypothetical protein
MASDPITEYLQKKHASQLTLPGMRSPGFRSGVVEGAFGGGMHGLGKHIGGGAMAAGGALAVAGGAAVASKIYDAVTKTRDFRAMLQENPDLAEKHQENPRMVNRFFSTLRAFNPSFSSDPVVAGNYVRQMVDDPLHAGGTVEKSIPFKDTSHPVRDAVVRGALGGHKKDK